MADGDISKMSELKTTCFTGDPDTVVVDLDGTLANLDHRLPLLRQDRPDWDGFYKAVSGDTMNEWCKQLMYAMHYSAQGYIVLIVTARTPTTQAVNDTLAWLTKNGIDDRFPVVFARKGPKDYRPDQEVKKEWLHKYGKERILFVVDDRQRVVDMWRAEGLTCLQCNVWDEWKKPPKPVS